MKKNNAEALYKKTNDGIDLTGQFIENYFIKIHPRSWTNEDLNGLFENSLFSVPIKELEQAIKNLEEEQTQKNKDSCNIQLLENVTKSFHEKEIKKFVEEKFEKATEVEKNYIKERIAVEFSGCESPDDLDGNFYMKLAGDVSSFKREMIWSKIKKFSDYAWTVIIGFIELGIILAVLEESEYTSNEAIYPILIIIYLSIRGFFLQYGVITNNLALALDGEFKKIRKLLKDDIGRYEEGKIKIARIKSEKAVIKMYVTSIFLFIAYILTIAYLLDTF